MTVILIVFILIVAAVMFVALIKFQNLVNSTKDKADSMTEEEKMSYSPFNDEETDSSEE